MSKIKLLQVLLVSGMLVLVGCGSQQVDDSAGASTTTTTTTGTTAGTGAAAGSDIMVIEPPVETQATASMAAPQISVVFFAFDSFTVDATSRDVLDAHADYLRNNPNLVVVLEGHTDERGSAEYNLALGENRAKAVQDYLRLRGVDAAQMYVTSFGEMKPAARGSNESAWALNRRVEIQYQ